MEKDWATNINHNYRSRHKHYDSQICLFIIEKKCLTEALLIYFFLIMIVKFFKQEYIAVMAGWLQSAALH